MFVVKPLLLEMIVPTDKSYASSEFTPSTSIQLQSLINQSRGSALLLRGVFFLPETAGL